MKIFNLTENSNIYTSNVYLVLGTWNKIEDKNTLIDVGRDKEIMKFIDEAPTGVGKKRIDQVVLTHNHYDHTSLLPVIKEKYDPKIFAYTNSLKSTDVILKDGDPIEIGDKTFEIIHTPGHSQDSICLFCKEEGIVFTGDTHLIVQDSEGSYEEKFIDALQKLSRHKISAIYPGHGKPITKRCNALIQLSLRNVQDKELKKHDYNYN